MNRRRNRLASPARLVPARGLFVGMCSGLPLGAALVASCAAQGGAGAQVLVIDFEEHAEGTAIGLQYAAQGVTFSIEGEASLPIVAVEGAPLAAFNGSGTDTPASSGSRCLTDPAVGADFTVPGDIRIAFSPPITSATFYVIDIETGETVVATAFSGAVAVASQTVVGGSPGTGNGLSTPVSLAAASIDSILIDISGPASGTGWGVDFLTVTRPCPFDGCSLRIRVAQESAPGAGDFAANILGEVPMWDAPSTSSAAFYAYDVPEGDSWNGSSLALTADRSHLFAARTSDGLALFVVHDRAIPNNPDGGEAETRVDLLEDFDGGFYAVQDDPPGVKSGAYVLGGPGASTFAARHVWDVCCTDGYAIADLELGGQALVQFTDVDGDGTNATIAGLTEWRAMGADGTSIPLALEESRRVRIEMLPPESCPADLNGDGTVNGADLGILLVSWGAAGGGADIDGSGVVDGGDLGLLLGGWGACPVA